MACLLAILFKMAEIEKRSAAVNENVKYCGKPNMPLIIVFRGFRSEDSRGIVEGQSLHDSEISFFNSPRKVLFLSQQQTCQ